MPDPLKLTIPAGSPSGVVNQLTAPPRAVLDIRSENEVIAPLPKTSGRRQPLTEIEAKIKALREKCDACLAGAEGWEWADALRQRKLSDTATRKRFLEKAGEESPGAFTRRARQSHYAPRTPMVESRILGTVFSKSPNCVYPDALQDFYDAPTRKSADTCEDLAKKATRLAIWKGYGLALLDRPVAPETLPANLEQEQAAGLDKPYVVLVEPENILDWRIDAEGGLCYVRITSGLLEMPDESTVETIREIGLADQIDGEPRAGIQVWKITTKDRVVTLNKGVFAPLNGRLEEEGCLPVVPCPYDPIDAMQGVALLADAMQAERGLFNGRSELRSMLSNVGHPPLTATVRDERNLNHLHLGDTQFVRLLTSKKTSGGEEVGEEKLAYVQVDSAAIQNMQAECDKGATEVEAQVGMSVRSAQKLGASNSGNPMAGIAMSYDFEMNEANRLREVARCAQAFLQNLLVTAALEMGMEEAEVETINVAYSTDFSPKNTATAMGVASQARMLFGPDHPATVWALDQASNALMSDAPDDARKEAQAANENGAYQPPAPDLMGGGDNLTKNNDRAVPGRAGKQKLASEKAKE